MKLQPLIKKKWKQQIYGVVPFTDLISPFFHWQGRAESLNWLSSSLKAVRIKAHSRATTARSSAAVLHARMLRINSRSLIDMAVTAVQRWTARGERLLFFCPPKKKNTPRSEELQGGGVFVFLLEHILCHVMFLFLFFLFFVVVMHLVNGGRIFCQWPWVGTCSNGVIKGHESWWLGGTCPVLCKENQRPLNP